MQSYSISQWVIFFFCYAFIGWIWECFYVSAKEFVKNKKFKFINRGFLHGPVIPIYGFAAVSILIVTVSVSDNVAAVYVVGALTATMFEFIVGTLMERMFRVKYWDYSDIPLNYKGHICLFVSLFWGFFSILLVQIVHLPLEQIVIKIPQMVCEVLAFMVAIVFTWDTTVSFNEAMELRDILESLAESNETIKRLERRFEAIVAFAPVHDMDDIRDMRLNIRENITYRVERLRWKNEEHINKIKEYILLPDFAGLPDRSELLEKLEEHRIKIMEKSSKQYMRAIQQIRRNPMVKSKKYQKIIEILIEWNKDLTEL